MSRIAASGDPDDIFMWHRLGPNLTTSGRLVERQLDGLKGTGVDHVINLAPDSHDDALPDERARLAAVGIDYTYIPVDFDAPAEADFRQFADTMDALADQRVHIHCIMNMRVSAFVYRYRRECLDWPEDDARAEMERIWRPGGIWAAFIGDTPRTAADHALAGEDY